jgi:hypothetical protein
MVGGPCPECGDDLAPDQRYCISCGHRVESSLAPSYMPGALEGFGERGEVRRGFPMPIPAAGLIAAATLGFGVVMGTAISPNLSSLVAGERVDGPTVVQAPPEDEKPDKSSKPKGGGGGGSNSIGSTGSSSVPSYGGSTGGFYGDTGSYPDSTGTGTDTGTGGVAPDDGGGGKKPKPKPDYTFITGTVVHKNPVAQSYSISDGGALSAIHAETLPSFGAKVKVPIRKLANGTFAEAAGRQNQGQATAARFTGVVTDSADGLAPAKPDVYTVSGHGASVPVLADDPTGTTPSPAVGRLITVDIQFRSAQPTDFPPATGPFLCADPAPPTSFPTPPLFPGKQVWQAGSPTLNAAPITSAVIETVTQWTCAAPGRAVISADDIHYSGRNLDLPTSPAVDPNKFAWGEALMASVTIAGGAVTQIDGARSDQGVKGADSAVTGQGTLARVASLARLARVARATDLKIEKFAARNARR